MCKSRREAAQAGGRVSPVGLVAVVAVYVAVALADGAPAARPHAFLTSARSLIQHGLHKTLWPFFFANQRPPVAQLVPAAANAHNGNSHKLSAITSSSPSSPSSSSSSSTGNKLKESETSEPDDGELDFDAMDELMANGNEKRFEDYGHFRFGRAGGGSSPDYGHMRFGRGGGEPGDYGHFRFGRGAEMGDYGHMRFG